MLIERHTLLNAIESVTPGLSTRGMIAQSACIIFMGKHLVTFNDLISCRFTMDEDTGITAAVPVEPIRAILHRLKEEQVDISLEAGELRIKGKSGRESGIRVDTEITLPIDKVEKPAKGDWAKLPDSFPTIATRVAACASKDSGMHMVTCVHMTKDFVEATDNSQAIRYTLSLPVKDSVFIRATAMEHIKLALPKSIACTSAWVHFRNGMGLVMSIRQEVAAQAKYPDISRALKLDGVDITLPKGLSEACERAEIFSAEDAESNMVSVSIVPGKPLVIRGEGSTGWYRENKKIDYTGPELRFVISPKLLSGLVSEALPTKVGATSKTNVMLMQGESFTYVVALEKEKPTVTETETAAESDGE